MKVIFLQHVLHVAKQGEVKDVSSGYASNFLFPKSLAEPYTQSHIDSKKKALQKNESARRMLLGGKQEMLDSLEGKIFEFFLKGNTQKLYGSVSPKDVAEYIQKKYKFPLTKKHIDFGVGVHSFKEKGEFQIYIDLGNNHAVKSKVKISVK